MVQKRVWGEVAQIVEEVCLRLEAGELLAVVCREAEMPQETTLRGWLTRFPDLKARVDAARAAGAAVRAARPLVIRVRPVAFDAALASAVCERLSRATQGLEAVCADPELPSSATVYRWLKDYPDFARAYGEARRVQAHRMFDEARAIAQAATDKTARVAKLRIDTLKWQAAKLAPRTYGVRAETEMEAVEPRAFNVEVVHFGPIEELEDEVQNLRRLIAEAGLALPPREVEPEDWR